MNHCPLRNLAHPPAQRQPPPPLPRAWEKFRQPPRARQRLVLHAFRIRSHILRQTLRRSPFAQHNLRALRIHHQSLLHRLQQHPLKRDLRQPRFAFGVTAPHVRVHAHKPYLPNILARIIRARRQRFAPRIALEAASLLVNGHGMPPGADNRILPVETQIDGRVHPPVRAHRIPHPAKVNLHFARERILKCLFRRIRRLLRVRALGQLSVQLQNVGDQLLIARLQQPIHMQQAGNGARRVRTAAESKNENVVTRLVRLHTCSDRRPRRFPAALCRRQAHHLRPPFRYRPAHVRHAHSTHPQVVVGDLLVADFQAVVQLHYVGVGVGILEVVSRPVAANHNVLRHRAPRGRWG